MTVMESEPESDDADELLTSWEFARSKQVGEHAVHRLRDWVAGETVWGYDIYVGEDASSTLGKTFKRGGRVLPDDSSFVDLVTQRMRRQLATTRAPAVGFVWAATIVSLSEESGATRHDPEPPMKFAQLTDVLVVARVTREDEE